MDYPTINDFDAGDRVRFTYTTKVMGNRPTKSGEVVQAGGNVIKIEVDDTDPYEGESDVFALIGEVDHLKNVFYVREGNQEDTFCGDRARLMRPEPHAEPPTAD